MAAVPAGVGGEEEVPVIGRVRGVLQSALGSQEHGEGGGRLNLAGDGSSAVYLRERVVGVHLG